MPRDLVKRDRTARLLAVAHLLFQHPRGLTAAEIGQRVGMNVRTAYRDLRALEGEVGVAVWQDGARYGAERTSFLPPLKLTLHEAVTLFLSARLMDRYADHRDAHVVSAFNKIASILPAPVGQHVHATVASMTRAPADDTRTRIFDILATAWAEGRKVRIQYPYTSARGQTYLNERLVSPYFIEPNPGGHTRYLIGHDSYTDQVRTFKVERIDGAELTDEPFDAPAALNLAERLRDAWGVSDEDLVEVRLRFHDAAAAARARETRWHPSQREEPRDGGGLDLVLQVGGLTEITPWILGWGDTVEVITPAELRERLRSTAAGMAAHYSRPS